MTFTLNTANLKREDELGFAFLVAEDEEGHYEPIELVSTLNEAAEIAEADLKRRIKALDNDQDPGLCPYEYVLFARTISGRYEKIGGAILAQQAAVPLENNRERWGAKQ